MNTGQTRSKTAVVSCDVTIAKTVIWRRRWLKSRQFFFMKK